jgi:hypothetical protein
MPKSDERHWAPSQPGCDMILAGVRNDNIVGSSPAVAARAFARTAGSQTSRRRTRSSRQRHHQRHTHHVRRGTAEDQHRAKATVGKTEGTKTEGHDLSGGAAQDCSSAAGAVGEGEARRVKDQTEPGR